MTNFNNKVNNDVSIIHFRTMCNIVVKCRSYQADLEELYSISLYNTIKTIIYVFLIVSRVVS